jgi:curved DNA-binding protein CbpA
MSDLYKDLGVNKNASQQQIKDVYRNLSKDLHPDVGGNKDKFALVATAYETLGDPTRRRRYDETGIDTSIPIINQKAENCLRAVFNSFILHVGIEKVINHDVVGAIAEKLDEAAEKLADDKEKVCNEKRALKQMLPRVKHKEKNNIMTSVINEKINQQAQKLSGIAKQKEVFQIAKKMLKDYDFKHDFNDTPINNSTTGVTFILNGT